TGEEEASPLGTCLAGRVAGELGRDFGAFEMLMRRAVVALRKRRALARLALSRRRAAAGDAAVESSCFDLLFDEDRRRGYPFLHCPGDLRLHRDRKVAADVLEERPVRLGEI